MTEENKTDKKLKPMSFPRIRPKGESLKGKRESNCESGSPIKTFTLMPGVPKGRGDDNVHKKLKCGFVSIIGRPNVGKSTLLNTIIGEKISIVSNIPQTTRGQIRGIYTEERGQIIFIDTPGVHLGHDRLDKFMNRSSLSTIDDVDVVLHLVDSSENTGLEERHVVNQLNLSKTPLIVGFNKVDVMKGKYIPEYIKLWETTKGKPIGEIENITLLPLSALTKVNIDKLIDIIFEKLPVGDLLYPEDIITDQPQRLAFADIIREKLFHIMKEEIPHSIAVHIERVQPRKGNALHIQALIMVERDSQKHIVIGKKGDILKDIGTQARHELEALLDKKVFLELFVKVKDNWREDTSTLEELGYIFSDGAKKPTN